MKKFLSTAIALLFLHHLNAQDLYMPRDIKQAYKNQTRSLDGKPGKSYWQNHGKYDISITAKPPNRTIRGKESIVYTNNSPDTLRTLVFKFIQNIHRPGAPRAGGAAKDYLTDGVTVDKFLVNGKETAWRDNDYNPTVQYSRVSTPLKPGESVKLDFEWHFDASIQSGREGMIDSTTFYLAYFYPRVAVYDDYNGWDQLAHNDANEFYNDFNDYALHVNVPANYLVWATGDLQNAAEVLQAPYLQRLNESMKSEQVISVVTATDLSGKKITAQKPLNTWTFTYADVSDMALGLSDHFVWDASSVVVDGATGRRASVNAVYNDTAKDYHFVTGFAKSALSYLSGTWPGVPYPFPKMTVFQGYAGMEYPMMANDETYEDSTFSRFVAEHEIAHTWFPFYMGINETRYGFMDEGWATTFELLYSRTVMAKEKADNFFRQFRVNRWIQDTDAGEDLPIMTPGENLSGAALGNNQYGKPALGYLAMKDMLGDDMFRKCLHGFMDRWHGKHPVPWDFFYSFNNISGKNLDWFWNSWFFSHNYIDLAIDHVKAGNKEQVITIKNIGGFPVPVDIEVNYIDGTSEKIHKTPAIWEKDGKVASIVINTGKQVKSASLVTDIYVDANDADNIWKQ